MISYGAITACLIFFLVLSCAVGLPLARLIEGHVRMRWLIAPVLGFGAFGAVALNVFHLAPLTSLTVFWLSVLAVICARLAGRLSPLPLFHASVQPPASWFACAAAIALVAPLTLLPQEFGAGIGMGVPIFDHVKIAIVDEIAQNGVPPENPFYSSAASDKRLVYYYLWHLIAAFGSVVTGATGWEADIALTFCTALSSILLMGWLTATLSGGWRAAWWLLLFLLASTLLHMISRVTGPWLGGTMIPGHGLELWLEQAAWVPQHLFSATTLLAAAVLLMRIFVVRQSTILSGAVLGLMVATAFGASTWVGGIGAALVFPIIVLALFFRTGKLQSRENLRPLLLGLLAAVFSLALAASVLLLEQSSLLGKTRVVAFWIYPLFPQDMLLNLIGYWLVLLPLDLGAIYILAPFAVRSILKCEDQARRTLGVVLVCMALPPLLFIQFARSAIALNDLGWRLVLLPVAALNVLAAVYVDKALRSAAPLARWSVVAILAAMLAPAMLSGLEFASKSSMAHRIRGPETADTRAFAQSTELWQAVQALTPKEEAVANNPSDLASLTPRPGNLAWALLGRRMNCAASPNYIAAFSRLPPPEQQKVLDFFDRTFRGDVSVESLTILKSFHLCRTLVVTARDGLWDHPLLADNPVFKLAGEREGHWRIYR